MIRSAILVTTADVLNSNISLSVSLIPFSNIALDSVSWDAAKVSWIDIGNDFVLGAYNKGFVGR